MEQHEVLEGWQWKRLGEVAPIDTAQALSKENPDDLYNYVALENIEPGRGRLVDYAPVRGASIASNKFRFGLEHVLPEFRSRSALTSHERAGSRGWDRSGRS